MRQLQHNKISNTMFELADIEEFKLVLDGNKRSFSKGFWDGKDGVQRSRNIIIYLIEDVLKWELDDVIKNYTKKTLLESKLKSMLDKVFNGIELDAIKLAYPELRKMGDKILLNLKEKAFSEDKIPSRDDILKMYTEDQIQFFFKSFQRLFMILKTDYSREELIDILKYKKKQLGRNPSNLDVKVPQAIIFIREFDSVNWNEILEKTGTI